MWGKWPGIYHVHYGNDHVLSGEDTLLLPTAGELWAEIKTCPLKDSLLKVETTEIAVKTRTVTIDDMNMHRTVAP